MTGSQHFHVAPEYHWEVVLALMNADVHFVWLAYPVPPDELVHYVVFKEPPNPLHLPHMVIFVPEPSPE